MALPQRVDEFTFSFLPGNSCAYLLARFRSLLFPGRKPKANSSTLLGRANGIFRHCENYWKEFCPQTPLSRDSRCNTNSPPRGTDHAAEWPANSHAQGRRALILLAIEDITDRKKAEEALRALPARLVDSQEEERRRIARELHDSTGQTMAALT